MAEVRVYLYLSQVVLEGLRGASDVLQDLPMAQLTSVAGFYERPLLMGCCNVNCRMRVPGQSEQEVRMGTAGACVRVCMPAPCSCVRARAA